MDKRMDSTGKLRIATSLLLVLAMALLAGCSLLFGGRTEEAPADEPPRVLVPTFTPTPVGAAPAATEPPAAPPTVAIVQVEPTTAPQPVEPAVPPGQPAAESETPAPTEAPVEAPPTATPIAKLIVTGSAANVRNGPGTEYGLAGSVTQNQAFDIIGKNADGTWWQFCCVNGQEGWIFADLVSTENAESVPIAQNIPAPPAPVAAAPPAPAEEAAPAPPPPAPEEQAPPPEAPPAQAPQAVNAGGCGGDDGCKFRISAGPSMRPNGGFEMKLQLLFKHSGVDGGQPQGDYRLGIEKDGQLITTFADARSVALTRNQGPMGDYNYEAKIGSGDLPGGSVAGTYFFWVLDGNRERDSEVFRMDLAPDQGEIWIEFDQG
jgi:uncharacterized protein YraI